MKKSDLHITFDLECIGTNSNTPIVQISAVKFNHEGTILDSFTRNIKLSSLQKYSFEIDYETIAWWVSQSKEVTDSVFLDKENRVPLGKALMDFKDWIKKPSLYKFWSHSTFDPIVLKNNCIKVGIDLDSFINYKAFKDIRTVTYIFNQLPEVNPYFDKINPTAHNSLSDSINQAKYLSQYFKILEEKGMVVD